MVADQHRWTVYNSKVNLPAALNDPRLAKRESDFFTKSWGLDFVETEVLPSICLPNITEEHFTAYLQEMAQVTRKPRAGFCTLDPTRGSPPGNDPCCYPSSQREKTHESCKKIYPSKDEVAPGSSLMTNHGTPCCTRGPSLLHALSCHLEL